MAVFFAFKASAIEKSELVGTWTMTMNEQGVTMISTYDFQEDGTMKQLTIVNSTSPKVNIMGEGVAEYQIDGDAISFKILPESVNFTTFEIEGLPDEMKGMFQQKMIGEMVKGDQKLTNVKIDGNTMTATEQGKTVTFKKN